jgi:aspartate/methionine/tyrosine aminotransferase
MFHVLSRIKEKERNGIDVVHFEIGDPDFPSPPMVVETAVKELENENTHYAASMGDYELREAVREHILKTRGFKPDLPQVLITQGANPIIFYAAACVANPGDEVIIPDPCFSTYVSVLNFLGINIVRIPLKEECGFRMQPGDMEAAITDKTKMIIINSPNNPTGAVMTKDELLAIAEMAKKRNIYLYLDEIYRELNYSEKELYSPAVIDECREFTIIADGISKAYAMTGWRLGYAIAPENLSRKMGLLLETISSCTPPFIQKAGIAAIQQAEEYMKMMVRTYSERRRVLVEGLNSLPGVSCIMPEGAFYAYANVSGTGMNGRQYADRALEECNVGMVSGLDFGNTGTDYIRLCYALTEDRIKEGIARLHNMPLEI